MAELFHVNKYKYNDEITVEERHYEWYTITCGKKVIHGSRVSEYHGLNKSTIKLKKVKK